MDGYFYLEYYYYILILLLFDVEFKLCQKRTVEKDICYFWGEVFAIYSGKRRSNGLTNSYRYTVIIKKVSVVEICQQVSFFIKNKCFI